MRVRAHKVGTLATGDDMVSAIELLGISRASAAGRHHRLIRHPGLASGLALEAVHACFYFALDLHVSHLLSSAG